MSTTVDQRVVEMRFDNKHFENNVSTTMSTLDKLKQKLDFSGASKGLEDVGHAAGKVNMNGLGDAVQTVQAKFSALQVMAITALSNITNQAVNAGKRIVSSFTIEPVKTGFQEYELKMGSVQTIMASTGESLETVNKYLEELNKYSDQTIYSFSDMTNNIGKFTNAGVKLEDAVMAIKGISNEAAISGANANEASRAMYNFSQALSSGYVKLIDWKSIENANMATAEFKQQLIDTAVELGTVTKASDGMYQTLEGNAFNNIKNFNDVFKDQWMTSEVLIKTLSKYADENTEIGKKAKAAATEVKTFSMMMDTLKEAVQSGWAQSWEIVVGDFEEAKSLFTNLANFFGGIIDAFSTARNRILEGVFGSSPLKRMLEGLESGPIGDTAKAFNKLGRSLDEYNKVVDEVIHGKWGNMQKRWDALTEAGYDWCHVQNMVNEKLDNSVRRATSYTQVGDMLYITTDKVVESQKKSVEELAKMSDAELEAIGYTKEQIKSLRDLQAAAEKLGLPFKEFIEQIDKLDGRTLLINSFKNLKEAITALADAAKTAWEAIFPPKSEEEQINFFYDIIAAIHKFSIQVKNFMKDSDNVDKITRTFKGLFAVLDALITIITLPFKVAFGLIGKLAGAADVNILDFTASLGDSLVAFSEWIKSALNITDIVEGLANAFNFIATPIKNAISEFGKWIESLKTAENLPKAIADGIMNFFSRVGEFIGKIFSEIGKYVSNGFSSITGTEGDGENFVQGFIKGVWNGIQIVGQVIGELATQILAKFREVLGIHSPSTEAESDGENFILGFINGIKNFITNALAYIKQFADDCLAALDLDWGTVFAGLLSGGMVYGLIKIGQVFDRLTAPFEGISDILDETATVVKNFGKTLKAVNVKLIAEAVKSIAVALLILVASIVVLTLVPSDKLWPAVLALAALGVILAGITAVLIGLVKVLGKDKGDVAKGILKLTLLLGIITGAITTLAITAKMLSGVEWDGFAKLGAVAGGLLLFIGALVLVSKFIKNYAFYDLVPALLSMSAVIIVLAIVAKMISSMTWEDLAQAGAGIAGLGAIVVGLMAATKLVGGGRNIDKLGTSLLGIAAALLVITIVAKIIANMSWDEMAKGAAGIAALGLFITGLMAATRLLDGGWSGAKSIETIGPTILKMAVGILVLAVAAKLLATMSWDDMGKAAVALIALGGLITGLIAATKLASGTDIKGVSSTLIAAAIAIGIIGGIAVLLGMVDPAILWKGIAAVTALGAIVALMIYATKGVEDCMKNLVVLTVAIAIMAGAVVALSFIDTTKMLTSAAAMVAMMGMFALMIFAVSKIGSPSTKALVTLGVVTLVVGALAGVIYLLGTLEAGNAVSSAIALGVLLTAMVGAMALAGLVGNMAMGVAVGLLGLLGMCGVLLAVTGVLMLMDGTQNATENVKNLSIMLTAMTVCLLLASVAGLLSYGVLVGIAGLLGVCVVLLAVIGVLKLMEGIQNAQENVNLLMGMLTVMGDVLLKISLVAPLAIIAVTALSILVGLITYIALLATLIGAVATTEVKECLDKGLPILEQLAGSLGTMIGNFVAGFATSVMTILPALATNLSMFMTNLQPFLVLAAGVSWDVLAGIGIITASIIALTAAELINGFASLFGLNLVALGAQLSGFMLAAQPFIQIASTIKPEVVESVKHIADAIMVLTAANILDGITQFFGGEASLTKFGAELAAFGPHLAAFADSVSHLSSESLNAMKISAEAGKLLAEMSNSLPKTGGLWQGIVGENADAETFGESMKAFGDAMVQYGEAVEDLNTESIQNSVEPAKSLADVAKAMPSTGGIWQAIVGEQDMAAFGNKLVSFGFALVNYSRVVATLDDTRRTAISNSVESANSLVDLAKSMPATGGIWQAIAGESDIKAFGLKLVAFGESMKSYSDSVATLRHGRIEASITSAEALSKLVTAIQTDNGQNFFEMIGSLFSGDGITQFTEGLPKLGEGMSAFSNSVKDVLPEKILAASQAATYLGQVSTAIKDYKGQSLWTFGNDLAGFGGKLYDFNNHVVSIDNGKIKATASAATSLATMAKQMPESSDHIYQFGSNIAGFGGKLYDLNNHISNIDTEHMNSVITTCRSVISTFKQIPKDPGDIYRFGADIAGFGGKLYDFNKHMATFDPESVTKAQTVITKMTELASSITSENSTALKALGDSLSSFGRSGLDEFVNTFTNAKGDITNVATKIVTYLTQGLRLRFSTVRTTCSSMIKSMVSTMTDLTSQFKTIGKQVVNGLAIGIRQNASRAISAASALGNSVKTALAAAVRVESPSKDAYEIGDYVGIGLINALHDRVKSVYDAGADMGYAAKNGLANALSKIQTAFADDMDIQPTISPVVDLSNVRAGANAINGMFGMTPSMAMASAGAISSMMSHKGQNGVNDDVISAINALRDELGNAGDTYNINGISYDEGSGVADAIKTIVRAAMVERRK